MPLPSEAVPLSLIDVHLHAESTEYLLLLNPRGHPPTHPPTRQIDLDTLRQNESTTTREKLFQQNELVVNL